ncbi:B-box zinc finger protein 32 [Spatholobus suberectus]|nr:B-box zinc finger protein 32 [Spatholobus suberectus]
MACMIAKGQMGSFPPEEIASFAPTRGSASCELCGLQASLYCQADNAYLCRKCDIWVHQANFLALRHLATIDHYMDIGGLRRIQAAAAPSRPDLSPAVAPRRASLRPSSCGGNRDKGRGVGTAVRSNGGNVAVLLGEDSDRMRYLGEGVGEWMLASIYCRGKGRGWGGGRPGWWNAVSGMEMGASVGETLTVWNLKLE